MLFPFTPLITLLICLSTAAIRIESFAVEVIASLYIMCRSYYK
ncbi:hypothetical protein CY0110_19032 [Crocosphaera chwakensis CCY0110]|uniref:Uncharacterized protein n=1 Tax=Crocosphaera chwakensis CCY0110 TaxID=391612 RepID=A3IJD8_9CHRO|nr:hypothetical protein CY0110_19032 [Crocosphaera chwakensis CCY0110]